MSALRVNILANYAGQVWIALMGIVFMPMYMHLLGIESFGLVGLMLSFQAILQLFDFGIGGAANRELSRRAHDRTLDSSSRDLVRTSEAVIWTLAIAVVLLSWSASHNLAHYWLHLKKLTPEQATRAITIMGLAIALLWPSTFYANCLSGLERQLQLNFVQVVFATLRYAGILPVMWWIAPTIEVFLYWHVLVGVLQSLVTGWLVWHYMPSSQRSVQCSFKALAGSSRFAGGLFSIGVLAMGVSQLDRFILTSLRPLEEMGYYTLALSVAAGLGRMVQPMFNAIYPRFSRLVAQKNESELLELYHLSSQYLAVVLASITAVLMIFTYDVLWLWTGDTALAVKVAPTLQLLVLGTALNGLMSIPYALQLAYGWTRLALGLNAVSLVLGLPLCLWAVHHYGMLGAATPWLLGNLISVIIGIPLMHRRLLPGQVLRWYIKDNLPALVVGIIVAQILYILLPILQRDWISITRLALASGGTLLACALIMSPVRSLLIKYILRIKNT